MHLVARALLALALVAGSWEGILPAVDAAVCEVPDADDDARDALVLGPPASEPIVVTEDDSSPQGPSAIVIRRIPHVPK